jgi:hypothetical protein
MFFSVIVNTAFRVFKRDEGINKENSYPNLGIILHERIYTILLIPVSIKLHHPKRADTSMSVSLIVL